MTLLDKLTYFLKPGLAILLIPFFFACDDPNELGLELELDESPIAVRDTTLVLPVTTVYMDSLRTDHFDYYTAVGKYQDSIYGEVKAIAYNRYNVGGGTLPGDSLEFESAHIILKMNTVRSHGPLFDQQLDVFEAQDTIYRQAVYLSGRSIEVKGESIASHTFDFNPDNDTIVNIPLADAFGEKLFNLIANTNQASRDSLTRNLHHFAPLKFIPGEANNGLFSFDFTPDTVAIYINMVNPDNGNQASFTFDFRDAHFVEVQRDISSSEKLAGLTTDFAESAPSGRAYLDPLAGVYTKIDLQPLQNFLTQDENLLINLAQLTLGVANADDVNFHPEKPPIQFFFVKENAAGTKHINGPAAIGAPTSPKSYPSAYRSALLSEASYLSNNDIQLLTIGYDDKKFRYLGNVTLFAQILADNHRFEADFLADELLVLTPQLLGLGQVSFDASEIKVTVYYSTLKGD